MQEAKPPLFPDNPHFWLCLDEQCKWHLVIVCSYAFGYFHFYPYNYLLSNANIYHPILYA